jgi:thiamine phosphate synthase YjbQ (UPF0047 family)
MTAKPLDLTLEVAPKARFDVVELRSRFAAEHEALAGYSHCLYWSSHTTAGFLDRSISARLREQNVSTFVDAFRTLFPEGAGYEHDQLDRRSDLDAVQRVSEPKNADSHLAFMASGLRPCVTHPNRDGEAVCFVDLDGIVEGRPRRRLTRVIGFRSERVIGRTRIEVPGIQSTPSISRTRGSASTRRCPSSSRAPAPARAVFASCSTRPSATRR